MFSSIKKLLLPNTYRESCVEHLLCISGTQVQTSNIYAVGQAPRSPLIAAAMSMTRVGCGQTGAAVNLWLSSQDPKKAETARLPKNKPYVLGYRSSMNKSKPLPVRFWLTG